MSEPPRELVGRWSDVSAAHAPRGCLGGRCNLSAIRLRALRVWRSHWSSRSPEYLVSLKITSYTVNCTPSTRVAASDRWRRPSRAGTAPHAGRHGPTPDAAG